jgi:transposase-like protein
VAKKRVERYSKYSNEFRRMAVERLKGSDNIKALAKELGVDRRLLYYWRARAGPNDRRPAANSPETKLRSEVSQLKRVLADKTLEVDFFRGALQKVEARRQQSGESGGQASTTKSGK